MPARKRGKRKVGHNELQTSELIADKQKDMPKQKGTRGRGKPPLIGRGGGNGRKKGNTLGEPLFTNLLGPKKGQKRKRDSRKKPPKTLTKRAGAHRLTAQGRTGTLATKKTLQELAR